MARFAPALAVLAVQLVAFPVPAGVFVRGLIVGLLTALVALGMALLYRSHRILNFAQADLGALPVVLSLMLITAWGWNWFAAAAVGLVAAPLLGAGVELGIIRRFRNAPRLILTVATIGLAQVLTAGALLVPRLWDQRLLAPRIPEPFSLSFDLGGVVFGANEVIALVVAPIAIALLTAGLRLTAVGVAVRAAGENTERAALLGVPVERLHTLVWAGASLLAFVAMFLRAGILGLPVGAALTLGVLLRALAALTLGRLRDLPAIAAAAVALGVLELGIAWNASSPLLIDPILAVVIVAGLMLRRRSRRSDRAATDEASSWQIADDPRPVPRELARTREVRLVRWGGAALLAAGVLVLPHVLAVDQSLKASAVVIYAVLALSFVVLTGWTGQVSLGQVAFFALGAAVAAKLVGEVGADPLVGLAAAAGVGVAAAVAVGLPTLHLRGLYLGVTTLAFALATTSYLLNGRFFDWIPSGRVDRDPLLGIVDITSTTALYYLTVGGLLVALLALHGIRHSRTGRALLALRDNEAAAESYGIRPGRVKLTAFGLSGALAAYAGGLFALHQQAFGQQPFAPEQNLALFAMVVIGGITSIPGAVLGALYVRGLQWFLPVEWQFLASGAGLLLVLMVVPAGLGGVLFRLRDRFLLSVSRRRTMDTAGLAPGRDAVTDQPGRRVRQASPPEPGVTGTIPGRRDAGSPASLLSVRGVDSGYGDLQVVFGADLDVGEGQIVALVGTNGAGKSTLLGTLSGTVEARAGTVVFGGDDITALPPHETARRGLVEAPGGAGVFPALTVAENLRVAAWLRRHDREAVADAIRRVEALFPALRERPNDRATDLSGGQRQMLTLGMALVSRPRLLMIDELSLGLAPVVVEQLVPVIRQLPAEGTSVLLVEQSLPLALRLADTAYVMEKGTIREGGDADRVLRRSDLVRSLFLAGAPRPTSHPPPAPSERRARAAPARHDGPPPARAPASGDRPPALEVVGLTRSFGGIRALDRVDLAVEGGEIVGIVGPNGAGKTTLFDVVSGFTAPDSGTVRLSGVDISRLPPHARARRGLGRSFQDARLFPSITVTEAVATALDRWMPARSPLSAALHLPTVYDAEARVRVRVDELLDLLGLGPFANAFVRELSTGTRRLVDLACVLAHHPEVVLLDEPSSGIAQAETEALAALLRRARDELGAALVVVEHDVPLVRDLAERLVAMDLGRVVAQGTPDDVLGHPDVLSAYFGTPQARVPS